MKTSINKIISFGVLCIGLYMIWGGIKALRTGKVNYKGVIILREKEPKQFLIEVAGLFLGGLLFFVLGLLFTFQ